MFYSMFCFIICNLFVVFIVNELPRMGEVNLLLIFLSHNVCAKAKSVLYEVTKGTNASTR